MICASRPVPSVVVTSACVSPRVNSAEPCVRGSTPVFTVIGRTVLHVAAVDARLAGEDAAADDVVLEACRSRRRPCGRSNFGASPAGQRLDGRLLDLADARVARLLLGDPVGLAERGLGLRGHGGDQCRVLGRRRPVPGRLAGLGGEFLDRLDRDLHLLVAEHHRAEHHVFGQHLRLGLDHQHGVGGAGDDEVELRGLAGRLAVGFSRYWPSM